MSPSLHRRRLAAGLSFLIYLVPLAGPHAAPLVGVYLLKSTEVRAADEPLWLLAEWIAVLVAQLVVFAAAGLALSSGRRLGWLAPVIAWAGAAIFVNITLLLLIPTAFLVEAQRQPEREDLAVDCEVPSARLWGAPWEDGTALHRGGRALVAVDGADTLTLLELPGCQLSPTGLPTQHAYLSVAGSEGALYALARPGPVYAWYRVAGAAPEPIADTPWRWPGESPRVTDDGVWIAWIEQRPPERRAVIRLRPLASQEASRTIALEEIERGSYTLLGAASGDGPFRIVRNLDEFLTAGADGRLLEPPVLLSPLHPVGTAFREVAEGWVAWDGYVEDRRYRIAWQLAGGPGHLELPRGMSPHGVAASPDGRFVAASTGSHLNIGSQRDSIFLFRTADATELLRRYLPRYHRSTVAILGASRWLVYTDSRDGAALMRVLRLPGDGS